MLLDGRCRFINNVEVGEGRVETHMNEAIGFLLLSRRYSMNSSSGPVELCLTILTKEKRDLCSTFPNLE